MDPRNPVLVIGLALVVGAACLIRVTRPPPPSPVRWSERSQLGALCAEAIECAACRVRAGLATGTAAADDHTNWRRFLAPPLARREQPHALVPLDHDLARRAGDEDLVLTDVEVRLVDGFEATAVNPPEPAQGVLEFAVTGRTGAPDSSVRRTLVQRRAFQVDVARRQPILLEAAPLATIVEDEPLPDLPPPADGATAAALLRSRLEDDVRQLGVDPSQRLAMRVHATGFELMRASFERAHPGPVALRPVAWDLVNTPAGNAQVRRWEGGTAELLPVYLAGAAFTCAEVVSGSYLRLDATVCPDDRPAEHGGGFALSLLLRLPFPSDAGNPALARALRVIAPDALPW